MAIGMIGMLGRGCWAASSGQWAGDGRAGRAPGPAPAGAAGDAAAARSGRGARGALIEASI